MQGEEYLRESSELSSRIEELRRASAPPGELAVPLLDLARLHSTHDNLPAARAALSELDRLRRAGSAEAESVYYDCAASLAAAEDQPGRAVWLARHAVAVARRHGLEHLPHALGTLCRVLVRDGADEEASWVLLETVQRFEARGLPQYAACALLWHLDTTADDVDTPLLEDYALALAEASGAEDTIAWALYQQGRRHRWEQRYLPACASLDRAILLARRVNYRWVVSASLCQRAELERSVDRPAAALDLATQALADADGPGSRAEALAAGANAQLDLDRYADAHARFLEAVAAASDAGPGWAERAEGWRKNAALASNLCFAALLPRPLRWPPWRRWCHARCCVSREWSYAMMCLCALAVALPCAYVSKHASTVPGRALFLWLALLPLLANLGALALASRDLVRARLSAA